MHYKKVNKLIYTAILFCSTYNSSFSQGNWDLKYIPIDSVGISILGKEVRLDFKASNRDVIDGTIDVLFIRYLLQKKDTISINVENIKLLFKETWHLYPDHGVLDEQELVSVNRVDDKILKIKEVFLERIDSFLLTFEIFLYQIENKNAIFYKKQRVVINKSEIKGLLIRWE